MNSKNQSVSIGDIGSKLGMTGGVSMDGIAEKIGYTQRPIDLTELDKAVDKYLKKEAD